MDRELGESFIMCALQSTGPLRYIKEFYNSLVLSTGKLQNLSEIRLSAQVFGRLCVLLYQGKSPLKNASTLMIRPITK